MPGTLATELCTIRAGAEGGEVRSMTRRGESWGWEQIGGKRAD